MSETFSMRHRSGDDDGDNNSVMEWEITSSDGFFWTKDACTVLGNSNTDAGLWSWRTSGYCSSVS